MKTIALLMVIICMLSVGCGEEKNNNDNSNVPTIEKKEKQNLEKKENVEYQENVENKGKPLDDTIVVSPEEKSKISELTMTMGLSDEEKEKIARIIKQMGLDVMQLEWLSTGQDKNFYNYIVIKRFSEKKYLHWLNVSIKKEANNISVSMVNGGDNKGTPFPIYKNDLMVATMGSFPEPSKEICEKIVNAIKDDNAYPNTLKIVYNTNGKTNDIKDGIAYQLNSSGKISFIVTLDRICKTNNGNATYRQTFFFDSKGNVLHVN